MFTVFGASGYIGRHLVWALRARGFDVYEPDRKSVDIYSRPLGKIIYAIGLTADFRTRPFDTIRAHISLLAEILEKANFESLLYLSSTRVYAGSVCGDEDAALLVQPESSSDLYNISKLMGESLCHHCGRDGVRIARLSNVIGANYDQNSINFIYSLAREALAGHITLRSSPELRKDYVCIDDVVRILIAIALDGRQKVYNLTSGYGISNAEWVERLVALTNCTVTVLPESGGLMFPVINNQRIRNEFAYEPDSPLDLLPSLLQSISKSRH